MLLFAAVFLHVFWLGALWANEPKKRPKHPQRPEPPEPERERDENGQFVFDVPEVMNGLYCSPGLDFANSEDVEGTDYINCVILFRLCTRRPCGGRYALR